MDALDHIDYKINIIIQELIQKYFMGGGGWLSWWLATCMYITILNLGGWLACNDRLITPRACAGVK